MLRKLSLNPAVVLYVVNALIAMAVAWGWHPSADATGAIDTIITGVLTIVAAFMVRPVVLPTVSAAAVTVLTAFGAFHLNLPAAAISTTVAVASILLGFLLHLAGTPAVAARQGKTAQQIMLEAPRPGSQ